MTEPPLKQQFSPEALRDIVDLALWTGQLLLQHGANASRTEETVHHLGTGLGCDWLDVLISPDAVVITTTSHEEFRTKARRVVRFGGVDMAVVAAVSELSYQVSAGELDRFETRARLEEIDKRPLNYPRPLLILLVGLACAAFSQLFGGDWPVFAATWLAASSGMGVRLWLRRRNFNFVPQVVITAFVAGLLASLATLLNWGSQPQIALVASVLLLVPGVPLVNAFHDLLSSHDITGLARGVHGGMISLGIAVGLSLALAVTGIQSLWPTFATPPTLAEDALWAGIAALGFGVLFNVPRRALWGAALCGAVGHGVRYGLLATGWGSLSTVEVASFVGGTAVGFLGLLLARRLHTPRIVFTVPGIIPMIPGTFAFGTMLGVLQAAGIVGTGGSDPFLLQAGLNAVKTGLVLGALAIGTVLPTLLFERRRPVL